MGKPSNEELYNKYLAKQSTVKAKYAQTEVAYKDFKECKGKVYVGLEQNIMDVGFRTTIHNLSSQLAHIRHQLKKFSQ